MSDEQDNKDRERAIALKYHDASEIPTIVAKGYGELARQIVAIAKSNGVPVTKDDTLSDLLSKIETGNTIPEESFKLVAEILCFLYFTDKEWRDDHDHLGDIIDPEQSKIKKS